MAELNGSSYYRSNPYYQQGGIPDTALKNRKMPSFLVQLPQGKEHFEPTNKKHFQRLGYYSTIGDEHIIDPEPISSPSRAKQYFRNLNIEDIDGASTNSLISQAVKNRLKAQEYIQEKERMKKDEEARAKMRLYEQKQDERKRLQALSKMNRQNEPNYHEKVMKMKTEQAEREQAAYNSRQEESPLYYQQPLQETKPVEYRQQGQIYNPYRRQKSSSHQYHDRQYQNYRKELDRTQRQIKQLQNKLKESRSRQQPNYHAMRPQRSSNYHEPTEAQKIKEAQRDILPETYQPQGANRKGSVPLQQHAQYHEQYSVRQPINHREDYPRTTQMKEKHDLDSLKSYSGHLEGPYKIRAISDNKSFHQGYRDSEAHAIQQRSIESPIYEQRNHLRQTRQQHRRFNPTFLSYGSQAIGLAGRNIVGV